MHTFHRPGFKRKLAELSSRYALETSERDMVGRQWPLPYKPNELRGLEQRSGCPNKQSKLRKQVFCAVSESSNELSDIQP